MPTEPKDYLLPQRKGKISLGFLSEYVKSFFGYSTMPDTTRSTRKTKIHFEDEMYILSNYKLSGGQLQLNVRADRYIWGILDEVYSDYFTVIASCDTSETWSGGASESINQRGGDACRKLQSTSGALVTDSHDVTLDLSDYLGSDYIDLFCYIEDASLLSLAKIRLNNSSYGYAEYDFTSGLISGWNEVHILKSDFTESGTMDWSTITQINLYTQATSSNSVYSLIDEIRITDANNYPRRYFDIGLQTIPVAWWGGNTAMYEIQTACEAEGARFYADEEGSLRFENRQHYNLSTAHKTSQWQFSFDRTSDLEFPGRETDVINNVIVKLKPRKVVSVAEDIWQYGFTPSISNGATKTIWASLTDPCPATVSGILSPVSTTDYTANTSEDGSGTDKTAQISISITRFANAVKIDVTNNDAAPVYLTLLKLRGTPAKESDEVTVSYEDSNSVGIYGKRPRGGYEISNKYLADETYALTMAQNIVDIYKSPKSKIILKARAVPQIQLGDMITVNDPENNYNYLTRTIGIKTRFSISGGMEQEISCRMVVPYETLTYFTIGTSDIESSDVIAP